MQFSSRASGARCTRTSWQGYWPISGLLKRMLNRLVVSMLAADGAIVSAREDSSAMNLGNDLMIEPLPEVDTSAQLSIKLIGAYQLRK